jgi:hypothetical protein
MTPNRHGETAPRGGAKPPAVPLKPNSVEERRAVLAAATATAKRLAERACLGRGLRLIQHPDAPQFESAIAQHAQATSDVDRLTAEIADLELADQYARYAPKKAAWDSALANLPTHPDFVYPEESQLYLRVRNGGQHAGQVGPQPYLRVTADDQARVAAYVRAKAEWARQEREALAELGNPSLDLQSSPRLAAALRES